MRRPLRFGVGAALLALPTMATGGIAGCGDDTSPAPIGVSPGKDAGPLDGATSGMDGSQTGDASPADGGADGTAVDAADATASDATTTDASDASPADTSTVMQGMPLCDPTTVWGPPTTVLATGAADSTVFSGVTPDELTVAWTSVAAGTVTAWYADRASTSAAFGSPQALASSFGPIQAGRVSLSGDGLRIVGVRSDAKGFIAATRSARPNAFDTADTNEFSQFMSGESATPPTYATPLLAGDDEEFFYLLTSAATSDVVYESTSGLPKWFPGAALDVTQLERALPSYRRPSGISLDDLTLFYWDESSETEKMAWRLLATQPFSSFVDIGALTNASPTADCTRIYYAVTNAVGGATISYADNTDQ